MKTNLKHLVSIVLLFLFTCIASAQKVEDVFLYKFNSFKTYSFNDKSPDDYLLKIGYVLEGEKYIEHLYDKINTKNYSLRSTIATSLEGKKLVNRKTSDVTITCFYECFYYNNKTVLKAVMLVKKSFEEKFIYGLWYTKSYKGRLTLENYKNFTSELSKLIYRKQLESLRARQNYSSEFRYELSKELKVRIPNSASAICRDSTFSYSVNRRGTCSWHGGVWTWLD